ncbi:DUF4372 domain-containing protein [Butyricimonas faecihominis]
MNGYNHLLYLLFWITTSKFSLRDICLCLEVYGLIQYHLGFRNNVMRMSLPCTNEKCNCRIFGEQGQFLIVWVHPKYMLEPQFLTSQWTMYGAHWIL